ncbi:voltage-dependent anion channel [Melampsora americana]|nr:voltage-dependent anion channel [Melampsora americana]
MSPDQENVHARRLRRFSTHMIPKASVLSKMIHGMHWQAYPLGMGTAAVYILLYNLENHPAWAFLYPKQFKRVIMDPSRNSFIPTFALNFATILVGIVNYVIFESSVPTEHTLHKVYALFWVYVVIASVVAFSVMTIWFLRPRDHSEWSIELVGSPKKNSIAWAFPVFPLMFTGVVAINVLRIMPLTDPRAVTICVVGLLGFGGGAFMIDFLLRIMHTGFMAGHQANGAFVAVGPPSGLPKGFSALVFFQIGKAAQTMYDHIQLNHLYHNFPRSDVKFYCENRLPANNLISDNAGEVWFAGCVFVGIMLTGTALLLFILAAIPYWSRLHKHLDEILGCWATTFPNVGLVLSLKFLGETFNCPAFFAVQLAMTILIITAYVAVLFLTGVAIYKGLIFSSDDKAVFVDDYNLKSIKVVDRKI